MRILAALIVACLASSVLAQDRPNILWLTSEDHGPHMGCYGDTNAVTPNIDALARRGMIYRMCWSNAPVCAPARTTLISGLYPPSTGAEHMRSMTHLPAGFQMYPQFLRQAGYYCTNNSKEDYNLAKPAGVWDESSGNAHYRNRQPSQPFFAIFNATVSHESQLRTRPHKQVLDPAKVRVPAYHPDTPEVRQDWAQYYDKVSEADALAGKRLKELEEAGLAGDTIVFYYADHGSGMPRGKRWPYNSGLRVPLVVYFPPKFKHLAPPEYQPGGASDRLVSFVDFAPTLLSIIGVQPPQWMQGHAFMGKHIAPAQPFLYGFRGRMDERYDTVRSVTDGRYVYLRQYMPHLPYGQHVSYMFQTPTTQVWKRMFDEGKLNEAQSIFWKPKPAEELYDLQSDPDEVKNLAESPAHAAVLAKLRTAHEQWVMRVRDIGLLPEGEIHSRAAGSSPYEVGHDPAKYPLEKIWRTADLASRRRESDTPGMKQAMADGDSAVRYWGAMGLWMRGGAGVEAGRSELTAGLKDASPFVRIVCAQALAEFGGPADAAAAGATLRELAPWKQDVFVSIAALSALDAVKERVGFTAQEAAALPVKGECPDARFNSYVPRLVENLGAKPAADGEEEGKPKGKKKAAKKK
jgi:uncharacterized sulfatase